MPGTISILLTRYKGAIINNPPKLKFLFPLFIVCTYSFAQSAKDYYFPNEGKNLSVYKTTDLYGSADKGWTTKVYFKNLGDSALITTQSEGRSAQNNNVIESNQLWQQSVRITSDEILASRVTTRTPSGIETFDTDGDIIFRIPQGKNKKVVWENPGQSGTIVQVHSAEFSKVKVNGKKIKAVKVTTFLKRRRSGKTLGFYVDYYVEGIGRYKRTTPRKDIAIEVLSDQTYDPNPPTLD